METLARILRIIRVAFKITRTMVFGVLFIVVTITMLVLSFILLIVFPTEPTWIIFFGIGALLGLIFLILSFCYDDNGYYDDGKKETKNEEKKQFIVKLKTTCPHCGAPMKNDTCDYCGSKSEIYKVIR